MSKREKKAWNKYLNTNSHAAWGRWFWYRHYRSERSGEFARTVASILSQ